MTLANYGPPNFAADAEYEPERIPIESISLLGAAGGKKWAKLPDGRLVTVGRARRVAEEGNPWKPGQVALLSSEKIEDRSVRYAGERGYRSRTVTTLIEGNFADEADYQKAKQADEWKAARAARLANPAKLPSDALAGHPLLRGRPQEFLSVAKPVDYDLFQALSKAPVPVITLPGREQVVGPAAIVALLGKRGVELRLTDDRSHLYAVSGKGITVDLADLISRARPLLVAFLRGQPLTCALPGHKGEAPAAITLAVGGAPTCAAHLDGSA